MLSSKQGKVILGLLVVVLAITTFALVRAYTPAFAAAPPPMGYPPSGGPPPGGMMMPMMGGMPTMAAADGYVYILRGITLYQFQTKPLKLVTSADLPAPKPPAGMSGMPGMPAPQPGTPNMP